MCFFWFEFDVWLGMWVVYDQNTYKWPKNFNLTENIWSGFLILVCVHYMNEMWKIFFVWLLLLYYWYVLYQMLKEMTIFDWFLYGMWPPGICITNHFCCGWLMNNNCLKVYFQVGANDLHGFWQVWPWGSIFLVNLNKPSYEIFIQTLITHEIIQFGGPNVL